MGGVFAFGGPRFGDCGILGVRDPQFWGLQAQGLTSTAQADPGASLTQPVPGTAVEAPAKVGLLGSRNV